MTLAQLLEHLNKLAEEKPETLELEVKTNDYEQGGYFDVVEISESEEDHGIYRSYTDVPKKILLIR